MSSENPYNPPSFSTDYGVTPGQAGIGNVKADIGEVLNYSFRVWKENLGILIGATLIVFGISIGFAIFNGVIDVVLKGGFDRPANGTSLSVSVLLSIVSNLAQIFIVIGCVKLFLALLRGQDASLGMVFSGGDRFLPTLGISILLSIGFFLCVIPGIIVMILYWPAYFLVVDQKKPVMESFSPARIITQGNEMTSFLLALLNFGIMMVGFIALCFGIIPAYPLAMLLFPCAYLVMSGQLDPKREPTQLLS